VRRLSERQNSVELSENNKRWCGISLNGGMSHEYIDGRISPATLIVSKKADRTQANMLVVIASMVQIHSSGNL
jgi:hypothetical protein